MKHSIYSLAGFYVLNIVWQAIGFVTLILLIPILICKKL